MPGGALAAETGDAAVPEQPGRMIVAKARIPPEKISLNFALVISVSLRAWNATGV